MAHNLILDLLSLSDKARTAPHTVALLPSQKSFLVRVELEKNADYGDLHQLMASAGFQKELTALDEVDKSLPDATYFYVADTEHISAETVHDLAIDAVSAHKMMTKQPDVGVKVMAVAISDAWFSLNDA